MLRRLSHIFALIAFFSGALVSCNSLRETTDPAPRGEKALLTLSIRTTGATMGTKSIVETEEGGVLYENYIDAQTVAVLFFDLSDKFLYEFTPDYVEPVGAEKYPSEWRLLGQIPDTPLGGFKVVVTANWPSRPSGLTAGVTSIEDFCKGNSAMYSITAPFQPSETQKIPFYGVKTFVTPLEFRPQLSTDLGRIDLLRAMSKIEVALADEVEEKLVSVRMVKFNSAGACAPLNMYDNTHNLVYDHSVHLFNSNEDNNSSPDYLEFAPSRDRRKWSAYVPEYRNKDIYGHPREDCSYLQLYFDGISKIYRIDFRDYSLGADDNQRFNILRNHIYRYTINSVGGFDLSLSLVAQPWNVEEFDIDYKKSVSVSAPIEWIDDNHSTPIVQKRIVATTAGNLKCRFTILTPVGAVWYAVFEEKVGDPNHFRFIGEDGGKYDYLTGTVDGGEVILDIVQDPATTGSAKLVIYSSYGNVNLAASEALGGPYTLVKD